MKTTLRRALFTLILLLPCASPGFSLLGPYADWMDMTNGYRWPSEIGGSMKLEEEYRRNVPLLTYGFDQGFIDYFGADGIRAVEAAIRILNELPPASKLVLTNFPLNPIRLDHRADALHLYDLKSAALAFLVEQLGLAPPTRHIFDLRRWDPYFEMFPQESAWEEQVYESLVLLRNFDPETRLPSRMVNENLYSGYVRAIRGGFPGGGFPTQYDAEEVPVDPLAIRSAVADGYLAPGHFYTGLSRDDAGGLRYLLSKDNVNVEIPAPGIFLPKNWARTGARGGVEKIHFMPHRQRNGQFRPMLVSTKLEGRRIVRQIDRPDILFSAEDNVAAARAGTLRAPSVNRTGTSNWVNCANLINSTNLGPCVIQGSARIAFAAPEFRIRTSGDFTTVSHFNWGSFDQSTNEPIAFPVARKTATKVSVRLYDYRLSTASPTVRLLRASVRCGQAAAVQVSMNGVDWTTVAAFVNRGREVRWDYFGPYDPLLQFRVVRSDIPGPTFPGVTLDEQIILIEAERERLQGQGRTWPLLPPLPSTEVLMESTGPY